MSKIILKKSAVAGKAPVAGDLEYGELALNYTDSKLYFKKSDNTIADISGGGGGGTQLQNRYSYVATAAQTTFAAEYTAPYVDVYLNGLRLSPGVDYTATSGTTIVLVDAAVANDLVEIVAQVASTTVLVDATKLPLAGGTLTGSVTLSTGTASGVAYLNGSKVLATGSALTFDGTTFTSGAHTLSTGNLSFGTTGQRITGDFSNATAANRVMFQTSTVNGATRVHAIPNGTGNTTAIAAINNSDPSNASWMQLAAGPTEAQLNSTISGTGTYLPMTFYTGGSERVRVDIDGYFGIGVEPVSWLGKLQASQGVSAILSANSSVATLTAGSASMFGLASAYVKRYGDTYSGNFGAVASSATGGAEFGAGSINGPLVFGTSSNQPILIGNNGSEKVRIDTSGNVGIGTSSPGARLDLGTGAAGTGLKMTDFWSDIITSGSVVGSRYYYGASTIYGRAYANANGFNLDTATAAVPIIFGTNNTERMRIDASGHLLPGATNSYDLGSSSLRWRNIYTQDLHLSNGVGDYTVVEGEENLYLVNNKSGKSFKFALIEVDASEVPAKSEV